MARPTNQHLENQLAGMSRKHLAAHAREQIRIYSGLDGVMSDTRRALLIDAWEFVLRKKTGRAPQSAPKNGYNLGNNNEETQ